MAKIQNVTCYKGEDILVSFTMDPVEDITGWTVVFTARKTQKSPNPIFSITGSVTDAPGGVFQFQIPSVETSQDPGTYVYDACRVDPGSYTVLSIGDFTIKTGVRAN